MDGAAVLRDIVIGLLIAGAFAAWLSKRWLQAVFSTHKPVYTVIRGPLIAVVNFV